MNAEKIELYKKYRPSNLKDVIGQDNKVKLLRNKIENGKIPHAILLIGPSGVGKTTIARCLRRPLKCNIKYFHELNIADIRGIETVRDIRSNMMSYPLSGQTKVWLLDEVSELTSSAQKALLKMLEDTPSHVYFMLATTDPQKLIRPIRTRCMEINLKPIHSEDLTSIIKGVLKAEGKKLTNKVIEKITDCSNGSARLALVFLDAVIDLDNEDEMLSVIKSEGEQAIELCRMLINKRKWNDIANLLRSLEGQDVEGIRRLILKYMRTCLLQGGPLGKKSHSIMTCFEPTFFYTGEAGLAMACWEAIHI